MEILSNDLSHLLYFLDFQALSNLLILYFVYEAISPLYYTVSQF